VLLDVLISVQVLVTDPTNDIHVLTEPWSVTNMIFHLSFVIIL
jgi:hypothetical protein